MTVLALTHEATFALLTAVLGAAALAVAWAIWRYDTSPRAPRRSALAGIALVVPIIPIAAVLSSGGASTPRVIAVAATDFGVDSTPLGNVQGDYTVQIQNTASEPVLVSVAGGRHPVRVAVPVDGWAFPTALFPAATSYTVALAPVQKGPAIDLYYSH